MKRVMALLFAVVLSLGLVGLSMADSDGNDNGHGNNGHDNGGHHGHNGNNGHGSVGPQGPQGNPGTNGANGTNGLNGASGVNGTNGINGIDAVDQSRFLGELDLRLWDTKHTSFYAFDSYGFNDAPGNDVVMDGRNAFYGFKFVVKLGSSYEERLLDKQAGQIKALEAALAKLSR